MGDIHNPIVWEYGGVIPINTILNIGSIRRGYSEVIGIISNIVKINCVRALKIGI